MLDELQGLKDKSKALSGDSEKGNQSVGIRAKSNEQVGAGRLSEYEVLSNSESSETDSDIEARVDHDMAEASALLQPRFQRHKGKNKSLKKIEQKIQLARPYNYLDRDTQRHVSREKHRS